MDHFAKNNSFTGNLSLKQLGQRLFSRKWIVIIAILVFNMIESALNLHRKSIQSPIYSIKPLFFQHTQFTPMNYHSHYLNNPLNISLSFTHLLNLPLTKFKPHSTLLIYNSLNHPLILHSQSEQTHTKTLGKTLKKDL